MRLGVGFLGQPRTPCYNVSKLKESMEDENLHGPTHDPPPPEIINNQEEYEVERILDSRMSGRQGLQYLVKWKGYGNEENSWEPERNLANAQDLLQHYHRDHPQAPKHISSLTAWPRQLSPLIDVTTGEVTSGLPQSDPAYDTMHEMQPHHTTQPPLQEMPKHRVPPPP